MFPRFEGVIHSEVPADREGAKSFCSDCSIFTGRPENYLGHGFALRIKSFEGPEVSFFYGLESQTNPANDSACRNIVKFENWLPNIGKR